MTEAKKYVWDGAIPLQIHLHESEVTTLPPPPPALILAPRIGYLPLLVSYIKPHFSSTLPPGVDTIWFEYKGLPLKWYIPTGVLFDLLCAEPERPWNLTVHFRGYPSNILLPCEGEDSVKWSFINSLKEAAYLINGNCKNVMNMSQPDQVELWRSIVNGNLEAYLQVSSKLKLETIEDEYTAKVNSSSMKSRQTTGETDVAGQVKAGRIPVRLYVWTVSEDFDDLDDAPQIDNWDKVSYINRPVEFHKAEGKCFSLNDAVKGLLPEFFPRSSVINEESLRAESQDQQEIPSEDKSSNRSAENGKENSCDHVASCDLSESAEIKLVRIQGIEPKLEIPFTWVVNNLMNPEYFLHICLCVKVPRGSTL
ncbi:Autophagy protein 5 [Quillaja saponaria]|uniref:Autophagy protein 5 n=1 Tax=Quillaja saponaria TaxID=32244 RepID=A0AAD7LKV8_QUISA|nr:Autophagy protein 5 [Quillaja saponaria]